MTDLRKYEVTFIYSYQDQNDKAVLNIKIKPEDDKLFYTIRILL